MKFELAVGILLLVVEASYLVVGDNLAIEGSHFMNSQRASPYRNWLKGGGRCWLVKTWLHLTRFGPECSSFQLAANLHLLCERNFLENL